MLCFATSQIVYMASPIPSTIPTSVKIGLVCSQLSTSRPPPTPRITEIPNRSPRSKATPQLALGGRSSLPASGSIAPARTSANEEPDAGRRDQASDRQADEDQQRRGAEHPIQDEAGDRASNDRDHHDQGHQAHDLDEPGRGQLCHLQFDSERSDGASIPEPDRAGENGPQAVAWPATSVCGSPGPGNRATLCAH